MRRASLTPISHSGSREFASAGESFDIVRSDIRWFCIYGCFIKQVSVTLLVPRRNHCVPLSGSEENRTPVRNVGGATYSTKVEKYMSDLNQRPTVYKSVVPTTDIVIFRGNRRGGLELSTLYSQQILSLVRLPIPLTLPKKSLFPSRRVKCTIFIKGDFHLLISEVGMFCLQLVSSI